MSKTRKLGRTPDEGVYQLESSVTYEVGSGGEYETLNEGMADLMRRRPTLGVRAVLNMMEGFVMQEQVLIDGLDCSWITITGTDAVTTIQRSALDTEFEGRFPAFGATNGGFAPVIDQLFDMDSSGDSSGRDFLYIINSSRAIVLHDAGCTNAGGRGIIAFGNSSVICINTNFSNSGDQAIDARNGCLVVATGSNLSNCDTTCVDCRHNSTVTINDADCSNSGNHGINCQYNSNVDARNTNVSGASGRGVLATERSMVNAFNVNASSTGSHGIRATGGSLINARDATGSLNITPNTLTSDGIIFQ